MEGGQELGQGGDTHTQWSVPTLQPPVGLPGSQPLLPSTMDPSPRAQGE